MTGNPSSAEPAAVESAQQRTTTDPPVRVRWLGTVPYAEAWDLQTTLFEGHDDHLLLLEHPPVFTHGVRGLTDHVLVDPASIGAELFHVNRGGDVTFHGPGQLVGYPVMAVPGRRGGGLADTKNWISSVEQTLIDAVAELGLATSRIEGLAGVWVDSDGPRPRKLAAVGVRLSRGRSMHGFALNVDVDLDWFSHIVPCGIDDKGVTSLVAEGIDVSMETITSLISKHASTHLYPDRSVDRQDVAFRHAVTDLSAFSRGEGPGQPIRPSGQRPDAAPAPEKQRGVAVQLGRRLDQAGVSGGLEIGTRKPEWMRVKLETSPEFKRLKSVSRDLGLVTVCEEAGCPNIFDCWNEGTATFMLLGERCTRACGFCLVDTQKPEAVDSSEPDRIADAVASLGLEFAVLTMVARDDLGDGGAEIVAQSVTRIRDRTPATGIEVLISDLKGSATALATITDVAPDIVNHNIETVARLQRAVRPSASYARSLTLLARAKAAGMTTKSGVIVGMGESFDEVVSTMADLAAIGVDIVTIGQYLRPTTNHLPINRWVTPAEFDEFKRIGEHELGIGHVESSPLTRSSYHAGSAAKAIL